MKRTIACLISLIMTIGLIPAPAFAETGSSLSALGLTLTPQAASTVSSADEKLFQAVVGQLKVASDIAFASNDTDTDALASTADYDAAPKKLIYTRPVTLTNPEVTATTPKTYKETVLMNTESPDMRGRDLAVRYTGTQPYLSFIYYWQTEADDENKTVTAVGWEGWTSVSADRVLDAGDDSSEHVALFRNSSISAAWKANQTAWGTRDDNGVLVVNDAIKGLDNQNTDYNNVMVCAQNGGATKLVEVAAVGVDSPASPTMRQAGDIRTGAQIVAELKAGYNFGGALDCFLKDGKNERDGGWLRSDLSEEISWKRPYLTEQMFRDVKARGFDTVRIPTTWYQHIYDDGRNQSDLTSVYHIDRAWMKRVHQIVDFAMRSDLHVILDTHTEDWIERIDMDTEAAYQEMKRELTAVWTQIADEFAGYDQRLIFEGMNEPHAAGAAGDREWNKPTAGDITTVNKLNDDFVKLIHGMEAHKNRLVLIPTYGGHPEWTHIGDYIVPDDGSGLVAVDLHPYTPYSFVNNRNASDHTYTGAHAEEVDRMMAGVRAKFTNAGVPVVFGEVGSFYYGEQWEPNRLEWVRQYVTAAKELGIPCILWPLESSAETTAQFYYREAAGTAQAWPDANKRYIDIWFDILNDASVPWGAKAKIAPDEHGDIAKGQQLIDDTLTLDHSGAGTWLKNFNITLDDLEGKELAVKYSGTEPRIALQDAAYHGWTYVEPRAIDRAAGIAYFPMQSIARLWNGIPGSLWEEKQNGTVVASGTVGELGKIALTTSGTTVVTAMALLEQSITTPPGGSPDADVPEKEPEKEGSPTEGDDGPGKQDPAPTDNDDQNQQAPDSDPDSRQPDNPDERADQQDPSEEPDDADPGPTGDDTPDKPHGSKNDDKPAVTPARTTKVVRAAPVFHLSRAKGRDHLYTTSSKRLLALKRTGWKYNGIAFFAPKSGTRVYELVNKKTGLHYYTADYKKARSLKKNSWVNRGMVFRALKSGGTIVYRMRSKSNGSFLLVKGKSAMKSMKKQGWKNQGAALRASH